MKSRNYPNIFFWFGIQRTTRVPNVVVNWILNLMVVGKTQNVQILIAILQPQPNRITTMNPAVIHLINKNKIMITGFEKHTQELTNHELEILVPAVIKVLENRIGAKKTINSNRAIRIIEDEKGICIPSSTFRKIVNHIRVNCLIFNLISTSRGYYVATTKSECERYLESLGQRIRSITSVYDSLEFQLKESMNGKIPFKN